MLVIHPDECIDCGLCEPECPINAIVAEDEMPADQSNFLELNERLSQSWPNITVRKEALADEQQWRDISNKLQYLEE